MPQNITEDIMNDLRAGKPLPDYKELEFVAPEDVIDALARRIDNMPDEDKIKEKLKKQRTLAHRKGIPFDEVTVRAQLEKTELITRNRFAQKANISSSHLTQFLNSTKKGEKTKGMCRDRLLSILITLHMDIPEINEYLKKFNGIDTLHASLKRDYLIMMGIEQHLALDEIDQLLRDYNIEGLENFK